MREVSSSIGLMVELDWQTLFNSFFSVVRAKLLCKNPSKIPKQRIYAFKGELHLVAFKTEDYIQEELPTDGDQDLDGEVELVDHEEFAPEEEQATKDKEDTNTKEDKQEGQGDRTIGTPTLEAIQSRGHYSLMKIQRPVNRKKWQVKVSVF